MARKYARSNWIEPLRQQFRALDFLFLLLWLQFGRRFQPGTSLRQVVFIELGPGPTRLAWMKRRIFAKVFFVDKYDFGILDEGFRCRDLEELRDVAVIISDLCAVEKNQPVLLFADHCMEHLRESVVMGLLKSIADCGAMACVRVPNIASPIGKYNYSNDPTHQTSFDESLRLRIQEIGFSVAPWIRWYRMVPKVNALLGRATEMSVAEEIAIVRTAVCQPSSRTF